jgi:hypothetical protein
LTTVRIDTPDTAGRHTFDGTAGQKVFVDVPVTTLPNDCGALKLLAPGGRQLASGCVINGDGHIDGTVLPDTGQYTVVVDPTRPTVTGEARLRIVQATDQQGTLEAGGPVVTATIGQPGAVSRFTFSGTAGQKVYVGVPSSNLPNECGLLDLLGPDGRQLSSGCVINGRGEIDRTVLPATGTYTVVVDPGDRKVGSSLVRLVSAEDQVSAATLGGPEVVATVGQPGAWALVTFTATAGQQVFVDVAGSTLPNQCGVLDLLDPAGRQIASGCIINGRGDIAGRVLPVTGTYTVVVDPADSATGFARVRVRL